MDRQRRAISQCLILMATMSLAACDRSASSSASMGANINDPSQVARGEAVYAQHCAQCHGVKLEGQPDWRRRKADGKLPAPPHDATGHTWHHPDKMLFEITRNGLVPPHAPQGYASDMPAFAGALSDADIWAVLAYIKSRWPADIRQRQQDMSNPHS